MSNYTESKADAWRRRQSLTGSVDFTMMYVAHDAFNRDLERLIGASQTGRRPSRKRSSGWNPSRANWRSIR